MSNENYPDPPAHLSECAARIWRDVGPQYIRNSGRRALFQSALEALDRADQARLLIAAEGLTSTTEGTGALHVHPAAKVEAEARRQFAKLWSDLGLQLADPITSWTPARALRK